MKTMLALGITPEEPVPRPLLVLDLDGTLLDAALPGRRPGRPAFFHRGKEVRLRPGLGDFLDFCLSRFDVAVWTAAPAAYAEAMCAGIASACCPAFASSLVATLTESDTEVLWRGSPTTIKSLRKLSERLARPLSRCLIVDDTVSTYSRNVANALPVPTFHASSPREQREDSVLQQLQQFFATICLDTAALDVSAWKYAPPGARALRPDEGCGMPVGDRGRICTQLSDSELRAARVARLAKPGATPEASSGDFGEVAPEDEASTETPPTPPLCDDLESLRARSIIAHVAGHVYLSNWFAAKSLEKVQSLGITHVLVCAALSAISTRRGTRSQCGQHSRQRRR